MRRITCSVSGVCAGVCLLLAGPRAFAQTDLERATARDAANNGRKAFDAGKYEKAIDYLSRAEQLVHSPTHLLFIARAQAKLGQLVAAHETYLKISRETLAANAPKAFVSAQAAAETEQDALDDRLPSVTVVLQGATKAPDVSVQMDGTPLPPAMIGIPLPADPGEHVFKASGPTISSEPVTVKLTEAAKQTVTLTLRSTGVARPVVAGPAKTSTAPGMSPATPVASTANAVPAQSEASEVPSGGVSSSSGHGPGLLIASFVSFGLGAASASIGTYYLLKSSGTRDDADKIDQQCGLASGGKCSDLDKIDEILSKDNDADRQSKLGIAGLIGGGVGFAAGVTFLIVDATRSDKAARQSTPHVTPVFGFRSIGLVGTF